MKINLDEYIPGARHIKWKEVLLCRQWRCHVFPTKEQYSNLIKIVYVADQIRQQLNCPITITSGLRPSQYNKLIKGAKYSHHMSGNALDFVLKNYLGPEGCDTIRKILFPQLGRLKIRMENLPGSRWIHIDRGAGDNLFFRP